MIVGYSDEKNKQMRTKQYRYTIVTLGLFYHGNYLKPLKSETFEKLH